MKKLSERNFHFIILAFLAGLFLGIHFSFKADAAESSFKYLDQFHKAYQIIKAEYVDEPPSKDVFFGAISGMVRSLKDPFSRFLNEESFSELKEMTTGKFVGVGIEITEKEGQIVVITPIEDSPAMHAGIMSGDTIVKVNDTELKGDGINETITMIKGIAGSRVKLYVKRDGYPALLEFDIERAPIRIKSVESAYIPDYKIGYIRIINFSIDTAKDVEKALKSFTANGAEKLIIDLRYNPGGLLTSAIDISEMLLDKDSVIVSTKGKPGAGNDSMFKSNKNPIYKGKISVIINKGSASASEILAGALRDNNRAVLIGVKSFGKGSVQKTYNLDDKTGLAITVAKYYTPSGELIHMKGIKPDKEVLLSDIPETDRDGVIALDKKKIIEKFITKKTAYDEKTRKAFYEFLTANEIKMGSRTADYILKTRLGRFVKRPVYDLEFDNQLKYALDFMNEKN